VAVGWQLLAAARPDGYTLGYTTKALMIQKYTTTVGLDYKRLAHMARIVSSLGVIAVQQEAPWKTMNEFLAAARKEPGKMRVGNSGAGATWHLFAAAIEEAAKIQFNHVPYGGGNPAVVALAGGHIEAISMDLGTVVPLLPMQRIRLLAINSDKRHPMFPDVPTFREQQLPIQLDHWTGLAAPVGTPRDVIEKVEAAVEKATSIPKWKEFTDRFTFVPTFVRAAQLNPMLDQEDALIATLVAKIGYKK
jgi:tripartite-type tricarboxylate transporter receptor subunit TctC